MNTIEQSSTAGHSGIRSTYRYQGVALIVVLCMLVLVTTLVIGFLSNITTDLSAARSNANAADAKQLSESAVNLVIAQISQGAVSSGSVTWTSQPGLIRTFDNAGNAGAFYKLYSSPTMVIKGSQFSIADEVPASSWNAQPAHYTDLNSPVLVSNSNGTIMGPGGENYSAHFPIIDGNNLVDGSTLNPKVPAKKPMPNATYLTYATGGVPDIDGFYVESPSTYNGNSAQISGTNNPVPMAVKWLYVLQNGKIIAPAEASGSSNVADFSAAAAQPTADNPIVGRIAFWTDDETCKVNINTAAGDEKIKFPLDPASGIAFGSFWDLPRASTRVERGDDSNGSYIKGLAWSQPYQNEFQRYPGHPATVALNTVFPSFTRDDIGRVIPRIENGGSLGGTVQLETDKKVAKAVTTDVDRLYASVDELMFKPTLSAYNREQNQPTKITQEKLAQSRFFLTASNRAPDLNLFGRPRVAIWPISNEIYGASQNNYCTSQDKLIAFCSTIGTPGSASSKAYYFKRANCNSSTQDYTNIPRNGELYAYLRNLMSTPIPGLDSTSEYTNFKSKYPKDADQILTEIYDYIRCVNLLDVNLSKEYAFSKGGYAVPIQIRPPNSNTDTQGFGRFPTLMNAAIQFYVDTTGTSTSASGTNIKAKTMKAVLLLNLFHPMLGYCITTQNLDEAATFSGNWSVSVGGAVSSLNFPQNEVVNWVISPGGMNSRNFGADGAGLSEQFTKYTSKTAPSPYKTLGIDSSGNCYPFCSNVSMPGVNIENAKTFDFLGGTVELKLKLHGSDAAVQNITLYFPPASGWPIPTPSLFKESNGMTQYDAANPYNWRISGLNIQQSGSNPPHPGFLDILDPCDTVRSLEAVGPSAFGSSGAVSAPYGDLRLVALNHDLTAANKKNDYFSPHKDYYSKTATLVHSFRIQGARPYNYCSLGQLVSKTNSLSQGVSGNNSPEVTAGIYDVRGGGLFAGDFDNGFADWPDGPYANKADEGDIRGSAPYASGQMEPYFLNYKVDQTTAYFSPNREISSAVMFGSLPTGVLDEKPWQTLLFRPDSDRKHPGSKSPKDHYLLDLFTMPIVEPYAISEPFSTAGKVNLNYQIIPFGKAITRETSMRSVLASTWIINIPYSEMKNANYKRNNEIDNGGNFKNYRYPIDPDATLEKLADRFTNTNNANYNRNYVSASEICDIDLYPANLSDASGKTNISDIKSYWADTLTGDNSREAPYSHLYPLLTTKSNTYTVHVRVQSLKQISNGRRTADDWSKWTEGKDKVIGEYRGSCVIERYIDPNDKHLTDGTMNPDIDSLDQTYKFRIVNVKRFNP